MNNPSLRMWKSRLKNLLFTKDAPLNWKGGKYFILILLLLLPLSFLLELGPVQKIFLFVGLIISQINLIKLPLKKMIPLNLVFIALVSFSVLSAAMGLSHPLLGLIFLIIWIWFYSILNILGKVTGSIAYLGLLLYFYSSIIFINNSLSPLFWGLYAAAGAFIGAISIILIRLFQKNPAKREILAACFQPPADFKSIVNAHKLLNVSEKSKTGSLVQLATKIATLRFQIPHLEEELLSPSLELFQEYIAEVDKQTLKISEIILHKESSNLNLNKLETLFTKIMNLDTKKDESNLKILVSQFQDQLVKTRKVLQGELILEVQPLPLSPKVSFRDNLRSNLNLNNLYVRHGIRFSLAVGAAFLLYLLTGSYDVHWVAMSIFLVLKVDIISTKKRMIIRILATIIGVVLAVLIALFLMHLGLAYILPLLGLICLVLVVVYLPVNYLYVVFFTSLLIIFLEPVQLIPLMGASRIMDVITGSVIAFGAAYLILPSRIMVNLPQLLTKRISSTRDFITTSLEGDDIPPLFDILSAHNNLQAGITKLKDSQPQSLQDIKAYEDMALCLDGLLGDYIATLSHLKKIKTPESKLDEPLNLMQGILGHLQDMVLSKKPINPRDLEYINQELKRLKDKINAPDYIILLKYGEWILSDVELLSHLLKENKKRGLFEKYRKL